MISRAFLHERIVEVLTHYRVNMHYRASAGRARQYAVWGGGEQFGEPTNHASAQLLREQLTATLILDVLEDAGVPVPIPGSIQGGQLEEVLLS